MRSRQLDRLSQLATGKWLLLSLLIVLVIGVIFFAVSLPPASGQSSTADAELLTKQIDFILKINSAFLGFLGIVGALLTWFFKNNLEDAKKVASEIVRQELDAHIQQRVREEFRYWEMSARTERVVGQTLVNYYLPGGQAETAECLSLKNRGFRQVSFCSRLEEVRRLSEADVVVLDCQNWMKTPNEKVVQLHKGVLVEASEQLVREQIDALRAISPQHGVLVVYIRGNVSYLNDAKFEKAYVLPANNQVTLLGHVVNGAYVAHSDRTIGQ
ncbi:hypothetical protein PN498_08355 [Oscillatoria sp. CS-180]|uniref:hypothetical protein n=1 Tax=Oscillatoria sp. CS-180 TaxID=3021720 RepID=UPI00232C599D|nr:hypothetical protein [Oscillatoria sp. CS-180]MDB9525994.1 hypothetical protein [Oscillatoria sp. CS-180]